MQWANTARYGEMEYSPGQSYFVLQWKALSMSSDVWTNGLKLAGTVQITVFQKSYRSQWAILSILSQKYTSVTLASLLRSHGCVILTADMCHRFTMNAKNTTQYNSDGN